MLLVLVLRRLGDRYTSYVVTDARIMRIQGVVSRRAHSIPWVRVTDLTIEQSLTGRLFGYATLHIESANEDSGLRDLEGVSDPMQFNQYVVDMVVAKQGTTAAGVGARPASRGRPACGRGLRRVRMSRRRRGDGPRAADGAGVAERQRAGAERARHARHPHRPPPPGGTPSTATPSTADPRRPRPRPARRRAEGADRPYDVEAELEGLDAETIAAQLRRSRRPGLHWADEDDRP